MLSRTAALVVAATAALLVAGCGSAARHEPPEHKLDVVASTDVWGAVARAVGGEGVTVRSIIDRPQQDPHDYRSSAADVAAIGDAQLTVRNGGGYDEFFDEAVRAAGGRHEHVDAFRLSGKHGAGANEHVFYDLATVARVADAIATKLGELDPANKRRYAAKAKHFHTRLDGVLARARSFAGQGRADRGAAPTAIATESAAGYLLAAAGIRDRTPPGYAEAAEKDQDIPAAAIAATGRLISEHRVDMLVDNPQTETPTANQLRAHAERAGMPVVRVTETLPAGVHDYARWMRGRLERLATARR